MPWWRRVVCYFCPHEVVYGRRLYTLVEAWCVRCGAHLCCQISEGSCLEWDDEFEDLFRRLDA
jgi:hypothetical protein